MLLSQVCGIVGLCEDEDISGAVTLDSIDMRRYNHATFIIQFDASIDGGSGIFEIYGGATDAAVTTALTFNFRKGSAALGSATADVLGAFSSGTSYTIATDDDDKLVVCEIDASAMVSGTTQYDFLTGKFDGATTTGRATVIAILSEPRYAKAVMPTAIPV